MSWILSAMGAVFVLLLQMSSRSHEAIGGAIPNGCLIYVLYFAMFASRRQALFVAIAAGLLFDFASLDPPGSHTILSLVAAHYVSRLAESGWVDHAVTCGFIAMLAILGHSLLLMLWNGAAQDLRPTYSLEVLSAGMTVAMTLPAFAFLRVWDGWLVKAQAAT